MRAPPSIVVLPKAIVFVDAFLVATHKGQKYHEEEVTCRDDYDCDDKVALLNTDLGLL